MFGCIYVPDFAVQAALLHEPNFSPVALLDGPDSMLKVVACNASARAAGVMPGMTKLQAEACAITLQKRDQKQEDAAQIELVHCAYNFSPRLEATSPGTIILDLAGSERLMGTGQTIAQIILEELAAHGFTVNVCMAGNPDTACLAARGFKGITIIHAGDEAGCLSPLPVEVLELDPDVFEILQAWGITIFRQLAALPAVELTERLGQYGLHLQRLCRGNVMRELVPAELPQLFQESTELEEPVELLEPLAFVLNSLLERLMQRLLEKSLATDQIEIELTLEVASDQDVNAPACHSTLALYQRTIKLPVPAQDGKILLKLAQLDLAAHPPYAPVKKVAIHAIPARVRFTQAGLFQPLAPEPAKLEVSMARIRAVVGELDSQNRSLVGFPALVDSHRPDCFQVTPPTAQHSESRHSIKLALRRFRPVIPARVELNAERTPQWIGFSRRKGRIIHASGPWRSQSEWWDAAAEWKREEWDIHIALDGHTAIYRIYRDLQAERWFVEGMYD
jgi:protein ImuB